MTTTPRPTVVVSRRVRSGDETAFEQWLHRLRRALERSPGFAACTITPPQALHPDTWVIVYQFADQPSLDAWRASPERLALVEESRAWLEGRPSEHRLDEPGTERVTLLSAARLRPGAERAHHELHAQAVVAAQRLGGLSHAEVVPATAEGDEDTVALLTFDSRADLDRWLDSAPRRRILQEMEALTEGSRTVSVVGGFAGWFHPVGPSRTKRWKQATVVCIGLVPLACVVTLARDAVLPSLPPVEASILSTVVNVAILTWGVMPWLTRLLGRWLAR
ncbi:antibiotic biosynthesis monooxygenase [Streptomyces sp. NPDC050315]|uniref:antibiotic biosynthesis monooxygenase n=1 Tax=Streptomyces sp. NPDC050315 TaxID=3155039 RepID=UPI0034476202